MGYMDNSIFVTTGRLISFLALFSFFTGCANRDVAKKAYAKGDYKTASKILDRWADAGYGKANLQLAKMEVKNFKDKDSSAVITHAKKAYAAGEKSAAFLLESLYMHKGDYKEALLWMKRGDIALSNNSDIDAHLFLINNTMKVSSQQLKYLAEIEKLAKAGNVHAAYKLAQFYQNKNSMFYNFQKSLDFYKLAYSLGDVRSGIAIALIDIYTLNKREEGLALLEKIANEGNAKASLLIGDYSYKNMQSILQKHNKPCIACSFKRPKEFYVKKLTLESLKQLYLQKSVAPWYKRAYKMGDIRGMFDLINLDITEANLLNKNGPYSGLSLEGIEAYLHAQEEQFFRAKMLLAKLYLKYPLLHKMPIAEQVYIEYMDQNRTDAQWHLYQYYKKIDNNGTKKDRYLENLVAVDFLPAKIENAYYTIIREGYNAEAYALLKHEADNNNVKALSYLASLVSKGAIPDLKKSYACTLEKKVCELEPLNIANDFKIANAYLASKSDQNLTKAATIYQFYADQNNSQAQYALSQIYQKLCNEKKTLYWLQNAQKLGNKQASFTYNMLVLKGSVEGDSQKALQIVRQAAKEGHTNAILLLGNLYASGELLPFDPKKALQYYNSLEGGDSKNIALKKVDLYQKINVNGIYNKKIEALYKELIAKGDEKSKLTLADFYINNRKYKKAEKLLKTLPLNSYPQARYMLYSITGNMIYTGGSKETNNGNLLLVYAKRDQKHAKQKALRYAFRASLCNTPQSGKVVYDLMRLINDSSTIKRIYEEAKAYPKCTNLK
jgi:TPR repeat protein